MSGLEDGIDPRSVQYFEDVEDEVDEETVAGSNLSNAGIRVPKNVAAPTYVKKFIDERVAMLPRVRNNGGRIEMMPSSPDPKLFPDFLVHPPNPTIHFPTGSIPQPDSFYLWKATIMFWLPHIFWFNYIGTTLACPFCKQTRTWRTKGLHGPRAVRGLLGVVWLVSARYVCCREKTVRVGNGGETVSGCGKEWTSTNSQFLKGLPDFIQSQFNVFLNIRSGVSSEVCNADSSITSWSGNSLFTIMSIQVMDLNNSLAVTKVDFTQTCDILNSISRMIYARTVLTYVNFCVEKAQSVRSSKGLQSSMLSFMGTGSSILPNTSSGILKFSKFEESTEENATNVQHQPPLSQSPPPPSSSTSSPVVNYHIYYSVLPSTLPTNGLPPNFFPNYERYPLVSSSLDVTGETALGSSGSHGTATTDVNPVSNNNSSSSNTSTTRTGTSSSSNVSSNYGGAVKKKRQYKFTDRTRRNEEGVEYRKKPKNCRKCNVPLKGHKCM